MVQSLPCLGVRIQIVELNAFAKLNFTFEVLGRLDDCYHEIKTIMQTVSLADRLNVEDADSLSVQCNYPELADDANLVWKAATALADAANMRPHAKIRIDKRIPMAMGLGGGSSDAASTLLALNQLWGLDMRTDELAVVAAQVGSDVSFFLWGGTALAEGRGERVSPLPSIPTMYLSLVFPDINVSEKTKKMYSKLTPANYSDGGVTNRMLQILAGGQAVRESVRNCVYNAFEELASWEFPLLEEMRRAVTARGGPDLHLCGAGPALFGIPGSDVEHQVVIDTLQPQGAEVCLVSTVGAVPPLDEMKTGVAAERSLESRVSEAEE